MTTLRLTSFLVASMVPLSMLAADNSLHVAVVPVSDLPATIQAGVVGVTVLSLNLSKDCGNSVVPPRRITLVDNGTGSVTDITSVAATINGARITKEAQIDPRDRTVTLKFPSTFSFDGCEPIQIDISVNVSSTAKGSSHSFSAEFPTDLWTDGTPVVGEFPLNGAPFSIDSRVDYCSHAAIAKLLPRNKASQRSYCRRLRAQEARRKALQAYPRALQD